MVIDDQPGGWEMLGWYLAGLGSCQVWSSQSGGGHWEFPRNSREFPDSRFPWNSLRTPLARGSLLTARIPIVVLCSVVHVHRLL